MVKGKNKMEKLLSYWIVNLKGELSYFQYLYFPEQK